MKIRVNYRVITSMNETKEVYKIFDNVEALAHWLLYAKLVNLEISNIFSYVPGIKKEEA